MAGAVQRYTDTGDPGHTRGLEGKAGPPSLYLRRRPGGLGQEGQGLGSTLFSLFKFLYSESVTSSVKRCAFLKEFFKNRHTQAGQKRMPLRLGQDFSAQAAR